MLNFQSLFSQWKSQNNSGTLELLSQPGISMGRLLDEDSFQGEYKTGNAKMMEFMKYGRYEQLVDFVTVVGPPEDNKRSYKYPLSACEILCIDNSQALQLFLPETVITVPTTITETIEVQVQVEADQSAQTGEEEKIGVQSKNEGRKESEDEIEILKEPQEEKPEEQKEKQRKEGGDKTEEDVAPSIKKTVIKKESRTVQRVENHSKPALVQKLLSYFDGDVNYTLAGYVSKVLVALMGKKPVELMKYVLVEETMPKIIKHAESRSVGQFIVKVLTHPTNDLVAKRKQFWRLLVNQAAVPASIEVIVNLSTYICEVIEKVATHLKGEVKIPEFNDLFFSSDVVTLFLKNVMSEQPNVDAYFAPILFVYLSNVPLLLDEALVDDLKNLVDLFVVKCCQKLNVSQRSTPKFGCGRLKILEILGIMMKNNLLGAQEVVSKTDNFFSVLLNLLREYPLNNMMHSEVMKIIENALAQPSDSVLNKAILRDGTLLTFICQEGELDKKIKSGESKLTVRKGFIAFLINVCVKMRELADKNQLINAITKDSRFISVYQGCIEKEVFSTKKSLAGLINRKDYKHQIMFQKEDVISAHLTFLQKCPSPVYPPEPMPEQVDIEHPDLIKELQSNLEANVLVNSPQSQRNSEGEKVGRKEVKDDEEEGKYWATHLEYNIDDLIADL